MGPQGAAVAHLVQLRDAHPVLVGLGVLGADVHGHLRQVEVGAHAPGGGDAHGALDVQNHPGGQLLGGEAVGVQVTGHVHEHLVDGVDMDVLRGHIFKIDLVDLCTVLHVQGHPGRGHDIVQAHGGISPDLGVVPRTVGELPAGGLPAALLVDLLHPLDHLEQPGPAGNTIGF